MAITISPNMNLPVPVVGVEQGPDWATQINNCMALIDSHTHTTGSGVPINPSGLDINADLTFAGNNATLLRSARFQNQVSTLSGVADLNCAYSSGAGGDLYYNDGSGNQIRLTQSGAVAGTPGSISNLVSPASAAYVSANQTFVWQSAANTAANLDCGSIIFRNITASSYGLTLTPPAALALNYTITLPAIPAVSGNFLTIDTSGNISSNVKIDGVTLLNTSNTIAVQSNQIIDNTTLTSSSNIISVKNSGINTTQIADNAVTVSKLSTDLQTCVLKAWVNFNAVLTSGTYTQSGTTVTVTMTNHNMSVGTIFYIGKTTGTMVDGTYTVATATTNSFTYTAGTSLSTSGSCARIFYILNSFGISTMSYVGGGLAQYGSYKITFSSAFSNTNYLFTGSATKTVTDGYTNPPSPMVAVESNSVATGFPRTTTTFVVLTQQTNGANSNPSFCSCMFFGS